MISRRVCVCLVLGLLLGGCAQADFQRGVRAFEQKDYTRALQEFQPLAHQGNLDAQNNLGWAYANGLGVLRDDAEAVKWYRRAAERGQAAAEANLGGMYLDGRGVPQNDAEGLRWLRLAAEQGHAGAIGYIGVMYATGRGAPRDDVEAARWFRRAADRGDATARKNLGVMYRDGRGVTRDVGESIAWFALAAQQGLAEAQNALGAAYAEGGGVPRDDVEAVRWFRRAAEQGDALGEKNLGLIYADGRGVSRDDTEAVVWFRRSADWGLPEAQRLLGSMYLEGRGVDGNAAEAVKWLRQAAERQDIQAQNNLGWAYANGRGVPRNETEALKWYRLAADRGNASAQLNLGLRYASGADGPQDCDAAVRWIRMAAEQGLPDGQSALGAMYENGCGVAEDQLSAYLWHALAADQGHQTAIRRRDAIAREMTAEMLLRAQTLVEEWKVEHGLGVRSRPSPPAGASSGGPRRARGRPATLIPRRVLFGAIEEEKPQLSPDGTRLAYLAPSDGVVRIWVRSLDARTGDKGEVVSKDTQAGIRSFRWQCDGAHILYLQDHDGDENWHVYQIDLGRKETRDLTPPGATVVGAPLEDCRHPNQLLASLWTHGRAPDVVRMNLVSGAWQLDTENPGDVRSWGVDNDLRVRAALASAAGGSTTLRVRATPRSAWRDLLPLGTEEPRGARFVGFSADNQSVLLISSARASAARLIRVNIATGQVSTVAEDADRDVQDVMIHPETGAVQAVAFEEYYIRWTVLDRSLGPDFDALDQALGWHFDIVSRTRGDRVWLVRSLANNRPAIYYAYDRASKRATQIFQDQPTLASFSLSQMTPISVVARDGMHLHGYLTLPVGLRSQRLPTVLNVHGGPWERDTWILNPEVQWLANRGYAVLQVNFRGSAGYGKAYLNAGDREWGAKMLTDLVDAKNWAVQRGYADPEHVCIMGASYGGYAVLAALAFSPGDFRCGIDIAGVSNLGLKIRSLHPILGAVWSVRVGPVETEEDFLRSRSPVFKFDQIQAPLLVSHGANDPNVSRVHSDLVVDGMRRIGHSPQYLVFPDEGHGLARPENRLRFYAAAEQFLASILGGRAEPPSDRDAWEPFNR